MTSDTRRTCHVGLWMLLLFVALLTACRAKEPASAQTASAAPTGAAVSPATNGTAAAAPRVGDALAPTDEALMEYLVWTRDWKQLTNRHKEELDRVTEQATAKLAPTDLDKAVEDPDFVATLERQGAAMKAHFAHLPRGPMANGFQATLEGMGTMLPRPDGYIYVSGRNEETLAKARKRYGDTFVDWVLERESTIATILSE
jgi:hypothetical protein